MEGCYCKVKLQAEVCKFTKTNTPPWAFFQIVQMVPDCAKYHKYNVFAV